MINNEESTTEEPVNHDQHLTNFLNSLTYPLNIPNLLNQQPDDEEISMMKYQMNQTKIQHLNMLYQVCRYFNNI